jgi:hypothetical protein
MLDSDQARFESFLKEAEFLRTETLQCIALVRRMTGYVTSIAGAGLPVLATILNIGPDSNRGISNFSDLKSAMAENSVLVEIVAISIAFTALIFLRIYMGIFTQIFIIARYMREHLRPELQKLTGGTESSVFMWEDWLATLRKSKRFNVGDIDLALEPVLIALYSCLYASLFLYTSLISHGSDIENFGLATAVVALAIYSVYQFTRILKTST